MWMPEAWAGLGSYGLVALVTVALISGLVRGFAGFGTAMIFLPVAAQVVGPFQAILLLIFMDIPAPLPSIPGALRHARRFELMLLLIGTAIVLPFGFWLLGLIEREVFRFFVSGLALAMLVVLISGLRYRGQVRRGTSFFVGGLAGLAGGLAGSPGPPVILFYMIRPLPAAVIRGTITLYLLGFDLMATGIMAGMGRLEGVFVLLGLALSVPAMAGNWLGTKLFDPAHERIYRMVAYAVIAVSALSGLPVWG